MKLSLFCLMFLFGVSAAVADDSPPNVIFILADDAGAECFNTYGGISYSTPRLNELAASGLQFNHHYSQPKCTHTRLELLTGKYNSRNYVGWATLGSRDEFTIGDQMKIAGYRTGFFGKWQLGFPSSNPDTQITPIDVGFDVATVWANFQNTGYGGVVYNDFDSPGQVIKGYGPDTVNADVIEFIKESKTESTPFFLFYSMRLPHEPFVPTPDSDPSPISNSTQFFGDMIKYMDKLVGRVVDTVNECGIRDNTLIVFTSDNGTSRRITSQVTRNGQTFAITGGKGRPNVRAGSHVPFIASWPSRVAANSQTDAITGSTDWMATLTDLTSIQSPQATDGVTMLDDLYGVAGPDRWYMYSYYPRSFDINEVTTSVFTTQYKFFRNAANAYRFYDIANDPEERINLRSGSPIQEHVRVQLMEQVFLNDPAGE